MGMISENDPLRSLIKPYWYIVPWNFALCTNPVTCAWTQSNTGDVWRDISLVMSDDFHTRVGQIFNVEPCFFLYTEQHLVIKEMLSAFVAFKGKAYLQETSDDTFLENETQCEKNMMYSCHEITIACHVMKYDRILAWTALWYLSISCRPWNMTEYLRELPYGISVYHAGHEIWQNTCVNCLMVSQYIMQAMFSVTFSLK